MSQQSAHTPELEPKQEFEQQIAIAPKEKLHTAAEHERHQAPMHEALDPEDAAQFKWKGETGIVQTYQHTETERNIHIDGTTGQFYNQDGKPTNQEAALDRVMTQEWKQEQMELSQGLGIGR